jgi:hypothetical protein
MRPLERLKNSYRIILMDFKCIGWEAVQCIHVADDGYKG